MDKVQIIVKLQRESAHLDETSNIRRWCEAQLIWEELQSRSFRALGTAIKEAGGSGSLRHLQLMKKCWEGFGQPLWDGGNNDFAKYPHLNTLYNSDEVRGEPDGDDNGGGGGSGDRRDRREPEGDYTPSGLILKANSYIESLERSWDPKLLTDDDIARMRSMTARIRALLRTIG